MFSGCEEQFWKLLSGGEGFGDESKAWGMSNL
jgi:hypothetical protein